MFFQEWLIQFINITLWRLKIAKITSAVKNDDGDIWGSRTQVLNKTYIARHNVTKSSHNKFF